MLKFFVFILCRFVPLNRDKPSVLWCVPMNSKFGVTKFLLDILFFVQHSATEYSLLFLTVSVLVQYVFRILII